MTIDQIAKLARLGLGSKEKKKLEKEFSAILEFVAKLDEVKADKIEPVSQATDLENVTREDKSERASQEERKRLMALAPAERGGHVKVRAVL